MHLFSVLKSLYMSGNKVINRKLVILGSFIIAIVFVSFNWLALESSEFIDAAEHRRFLFYNCN